MEKDKIKVKEKLLQNAIYDISEMLFMAYQINLKYLDYNNYWNYFFRRIGNYEYISRWKKLEEDKYSDKFNVSFQINDRLNHKNLFEWNFLYKAKSFKSKKFALKIADIGQKIEFDVYTEKEKPIIATRYLKELLKEDYEKLEKIIEQITDEEYGKVYNFNDIKEEIFLNEEIELKKYENRIDCPYDDDYYLYYTFDKVTRIKILGIYSIPYPKLQENEKVQCFLIQRDDYIKMKESLNCGKSLEESLDNLIFEEFWF